MQSVEKIAKCPCFLEPPEGITPTIGFANAEFTINRNRVTVYDLGGGVRIRDVWKNYYAEVR